MHHYRLSTAQRLTLRSYWRDGRDGTWAWAKSNAPTWNFLEDGRGDRYAYDAEGQLFNAWYEATDPGGSSGAAPYESPGMLSIETADEKWRISQGAIRLQPVGTVGP